MLKNNKINLARLDKFFELAKLNYFRILNKKKSIKLSDIFLKFIKNMK